MVAREADRSVPRYSLIRGVFFTSKELFPNAALKKLILPLVIEQVLAITVGLADTMMVSSVGEAAVSGVSLVDMLNVLIINIFSALATGGAVVVAQLLGARKNDRACDASKQLYLVVTVIALIISALVMLFRAPLLRLLFGTIEDDVMQSALTYLTVSVFSYPVLAIYNAGAALFRSMSNSRVSMMTSIAMNLVNISGNAILIYVFNMGVAGAGLASLVSRILGAVVMMVLLRNRHNLIFIGHLFRYRFDWPMVRSILHIGVPNGLENGMFQVGKVLVSSLIAVFGTSAITANAIANNLAQFECIPGSAMGLAMITVIGRCVGAKDYKQARYYAKRLMIITYISMTAICILLSALIVPIVKLYHPSQETFDLAVWLGLYHGACGILIWPASFALPNILRAANDVRFTMTVSIISMWLCRILFSYVLALWCGLGLKGVWIAMTMDWVVRAALFIWRYFSGKWETKQLLS